MQARDQVGVQVRPDGVDRADPQRPGQLVLALLRSQPDTLGGLQRALCLGDDPFADRGDRDLAGLALEQLYVQFFFQLLDRDAQRRLADEAGLCGTPEVALACHGNDVFEFREGHVPVAGCS